jgi:YVTN family beta-propeller protein
VLDPTSLSIIDTVSVAPGLHPHHIALSPDRARALVVATSADLSAGHSAGEHAGHHGHGATTSTAVYELDVDSRKLREVLRLDATAHNAAFTPDGKRVALGMMEHGMIALHDASTFTELESASGFDTPLEITPAGPNTLLVAESGSGTVAVYDTEAKTVTGRFDVGAVPVAAWASGGDNYFVSVEGDMQVRHLVAAGGNLKLDTHVIDPNGIPGQVMLTPRGDELWVAVEDRGAIAVLDPATHDKLAEIVTGGKPHGIAFDPKGTRAFVTDEEGARVLVVDVARRAMSSEIAVGDKPNGIAWLSH